MTGGRPGVQEVAAHAGVSISSVSRVLTGHRDVSTGMRARVLDAVSALGFQLPEGIVGAPLAARLGRPGVKEVAEHAGVAISSVSRVLTGHRDVSAEMRDRVLDAVTTLGYEPDILAQSLRTGATMAVGFLVSDISNPLIAEIALGAETTLRGAGYTTMLVNSMNDPVLEVQNIALMTRRRTDGLLLSLADETTPSLPGALAAFDAPVVLVDRQLDGYDAAAEVLSDHAAGMGRALAHLGELGHRSIALINGSLAVRPSRERAAAARGYSREHPDVRVVVRSGGFTSDHGFSATRDLLAGTESPTALIAGSNQILIGVLRAIAHLGLVVPRDLSLVTCDDSSLAEFVSPPLDTIVRDPRELGRQAATRLLGMLAGDDPTTATILPTSYRRRGSTGPPPKIGP